MPLSIGEFRSIMRNAVKDLWMFLLTNHVMIQHFMLWVYLNCVLSCGFIFYVAFVAFLDALGCMAATSVRAIS